MKDFGKFRVITNKPVALDSPDHLIPYGTKQDNNANPAFNKRLYALMEQSGLPTTVLDFGCAGGAMVRSFLDEGHLSIGIEGSDYSKRAGRAEWVTIPNHLFTADITAPFSVQRLIGRRWQPAWFTVVTAWEFLEHIRDVDVGVVMENITNHLIYGGYFICSICDVYKECDQPYHQNIKPWDWWVERLGEAGLKYNPEATESFQGDFVRVEYHAGVFVREPGEDIVNEEGA